MAFFQQMPQQPSIAQGLGAGLGAGIGGGIQEQLGQFFQERNLKREQSRLQEDLEKLGPNASFAEKMQALALSPHGSPEARKGLTEALKMQEGMKFAKKFSEGEHTLEDIISGDAAGILHPSIGAELVRQKGAEKDRQRSPLVGEIYNLPSEITKNLTPQETIDLGKQVKLENNKLIDEINDTTLSAKSKIEDLNRLDELLEKGAFDPVSAANFAEVLENKGHTTSAAIARAFASPESASAQTLIKDLFTDLVKSVPAKGLTVFIERIMRDMLPLMGRSKEANLAVSNILKDTFRMKLIPSQIKNEIIAENDGKMPWNFAEIYRRKLSERADKSLEDLERRLNRTQDRFEGEGGVRTSAGDIPTSPKRADPKILFKAVPQGTVITDELIDQFLDYTGQDVKKAEKMARKLGYEF